MAAPATTQAAPAQRVYRGWLMERTPAGLCATGPNYDASYEGPEDGWVSNGEQCFGTTWDELRDEIDAHIAEQCICAGTGFLYSPGPSGETHECEECAP
jgi:hypothetical protein